MSENKQNQQVAVVHTPIAELVEAGKAMGVTLPAIAAARGIEPYQWNALKNSIFRGGSDEMVMAAWDYCKARRLDPLKKPVHIVKFWNNDTSKYEEQILEGIASHRTTAERSGKYAGKDPVKYGPDVTAKLGATEYTFPEWAQVTVYKNIDGQTRAIHGTPLYFREFYARKKDGGPNQQWAQRPRHMLSKCAEAAALREAFPDELGGMPTAEEMEGQSVGGMVDITPQGHAADANDVLKNFLAGVSSQAVADSPAPVQTTKANDKPRPTISMVNDDGEVVEYANASEWVGSLDDQVENSAFPLRLFENNKATFDKIKQASIARGDTLVEEACTDLLVKLAAIEHQESIADQNQDQAETKPLTQTGGAHGGTDKKRSAI